MTLNEIVYNIKNLAEGGYSTDDNKLSTRQIKAWVNYHRMNILESYTGNGKEIPTGATQNLGNFTVPDEGVALTLPRVASFGNTRAITSVTSVDGNTDRGEINRFVDVEFLAQDARAFRQYLGSVSPDVDMKYMYTSDDGTETEVSVPMTVGFFWPSTGA